MEQKQSIVTQLHANAQNSASVEEADNAKLFSVALLVLFPLDNASSIQSEETGK